MSASVDLQRCTGCGLCVEVCPMDAIHVNGDAAVVDEALCRGCGVCANECPNDAIRLSE